MNSRTNKRIENVNRSKFGQLDMDSLRQQLRRWRKEDEVVQQIDVEELNRQADKIAAHLREMAGDHPAPEWTPPTCDHCGRQTWINMAWRSGRVLRRLLDRRWPDRQVICCPTCHVEHKQDRPRWRRWLALWWWKLVHWLRSLL